VVAVRVGMATGQAFVRVECRALCGSVRAFGGAAGGGMPSTALDGPRPEVGTTITAMTAPTVTALPAARPDAGRNHHAAASVDGNPAQPPREPAALVHHDSGRDPARR
jgi:hypothetical protein